MEPHEGWRRVSATSAVDGRRDARHHPSVTSDPLAAFTQSLEPETIRLNELVDQMVALLPKPGEATVEEQRQRHAQLSAARPRLAEGQDRTISSHVGCVPVRIFVPPEPRGVYIYIHGGGFISGSHDSMDDELWERAQNVSAAVVSVGYRLAPEYPYPAGHDDCEAVALWAIQNGASEFGTDRIAIGGDSAGAYYAAVTLLRLRDRHGYTGASGAELRYGLYDARLTPSVRAKPDDYLGSTSLRWMTTNVFADACLDDPDVSPLLASLYDMPPALFVCGTEDTLIDDTLFMWARWRAAGNDALLGIYPGGVHAFDHVPYPLGSRARAQIDDFLATCLSS